MTKIKLIAVLAVSLLQISIVHAQGSRSERELRKLIAEYHGTLLRQDADKVKSLIDSEFTETTTSGTGTTAVTRADLIAGPAGEEEKVLQAVSPRIRTKDSILFFSAEVTKNTARVQYDLRREQSMTISAAKPASLPGERETVEQLKLKNTEYFKITGTANRRNGKWTLEKLHKTVPQASDALYGRDWRDVFDENIKFGLALAWLIADEMRKNRKPDQ